MIPKTVLRELKSKNNKRILVQLPEGLKTKSIKIVDELEAEGFEPIISGDVCFGACDLKNLEMATTLHVGHSKMIDAKGVVYWEYFYEQDLAPVTEKVIPLLGNRVGLFTTIQHLPNIEGAKKTLEENGKIVLSTKGRTTNIYQVLGCDAAGAVAIKNDVDSFLYIGSGKFHAIAIGYYTGKKVVIANPFSLEIEEINPNILKKEKALRQTKAIDANSIGIVISSKLGQKNWKMVNKLTQLAESSGKGVLIIYLENVTPDALLPYPVDAFIITACPRIVIDDWKNYKKPLLLPDETSFLLKP